MHLHPFIVQDFNRANLNLPVWWMYGLNIVQSYEDTKRLVDAALNVAFHGLDIYVSLHNPKAYQHRHYSTKPFGILMLETSTQDVSLVQLADLLIFLNERHRNEFINNVLVLSAKRNEPFYLPPTYVLPTLFTPMQIASKHVTRYGVVPPDTEQYAGAWLSLYHLIAAADKEVRDQFIFYTYDSETAESLTSLNHKIDVLDLSSRGFAMVDCPSTLLTFEPQTSSPYTLAMMYPMKRNMPLAEIDVHSLFSFFLENEQHRQVAKGPEFGANFLSYLEGHRLHKVAIRKRVASLYPFATDEVTQFLLSSS